MDKTTAIIILVIVIFLMFITIRILQPSLKNYISRMPKGIFVLIFLVCVVVVIYLIYFLITDKTGGIPGNSNAEINQEQEKSSASNKIKQKKENCIVVHEDEIFIDNDNVADMEEIALYLEKRAKDNVTVTIVDDYAVVARIREVEECCKKKGVRYNIENEMWIN